MLLKIADIANLILHIVFATVFPQKDEKSWKTILNACKQFYLNIVHSLNWVIKLTLLLWEWLVSPVPVSFNRSAITEVDGFSYPTPQLSATPKPVTFFNLNTENFYASWQVNHPVAMEESEIRKKINLSLEKAIH